MCNDTYENEAELLYDYFPRYERLTPKEKEAFDYRFGFAGNKPHALEETAERFETTLTRIKQIERKACGNLYDRVYRESLNYYLKSLFENDNSSNI